MGHFVRQPVLYPVSAVFVDDHPGFLDALRGIYRDQHLNRFFSAPGEALDFLTSRHHRGTQERLSGSRFSDFEKRGFNALGLDSLTDVTRFEEVAAVVVDYEMDQMNGVEVFTALADMACTKILLTGVATEREAVDAFNAGIIDLYVKKSAPDMAKKLNRALTEAKARHCAERGLISVNDVGSTYCDARALAAMQTIVERERIVEYYWRLEQNAVLMFDASGQPSVFLVWDVDEWAFQCGIVADEGDTSSLRSDMEARRIMPLYWPFQAYGAGMMGIPTIQPLPIPGWDGAFYGWSRLESAVLEPNMSTYARWRKARINSDHRPDSFTV
ncbi:response regulator [Burkholderia gladioli]|uniref:Response regulator receiver protein n=1 Tax=Burkholderia gladioli (strain BSR3) TaxID=999541 RepID=F2LT39_BURGS|nr:response regulator [Burkholderia gladioli]AEA65915.1 response regulator receiver protein [Burkholderia gladioli BSR3]MBW5286850.1 response regulator [Burkholderia gladioli]